MSADAAPGAATGGPGSAAPPVGAAPGAAVLLVDVASRSVVFANPVALQMAPGVDLPAPLDRWSDAAALRDPDGRELSETEHPLSRVARQEPVDGRAVSAQRATELGGEREPLWVVGVPMTGASGLDGHALVVFLPLAAREGAGGGSVRDAAQAAAGASLAPGGAGGVPAGSAASALADAGLQARAVAASRTSFTVSDARTPDAPLVWVNDAFTDTTGYPASEAVGRNCRFLQGEDTDPVAVDAMRRALAAGEAVTVVLLNHRRGGAPFWNEVALSPVHDSDGVLTHYVGIQTDVTLRVAADAERDRALAAERAARAEAEVARRRVALLAEATSQLALTLDVAATTERLASLAVRLLADWAIVATLDDGGGVGSVVVRHRTQPRAATDAYAERLRPAVASSPLFRGIFDGAPARLVQDYSGEQQRAVRETWVTDPSVLDDADAFGAESVVFAPLLGRERVVGALVLVRGRARPPYTREDLSVAEDVGRRAGLVLDSARLYQREHRIAEALQRSLLPDLPDLSGVPGAEGVRSAARYRASARGAEVGGDFYELIALPDGSLGVAVGDVVGHDVMAAAAMGHLRGLLRACAFDAPRALAPGATGGAADADADSGVGAGAVPEVLPQDPADVLQRVDLLVAGLGISTLATLAYASLQPVLDGGAAVSWRVRHANAGHPPLLLRHAGGGVEALDGAQGLLLGVQPGPRASATTTAAPGSLLVGYTDGLVERRDEHLQVGLDRLAAALAEAADDDPDAVCEHLLARVADGGGDDDTAVLVVRL